MTNALATFEAAHPGMFASLSAIAGWNDFARSVAQQIATKGQISEKQAAAVEKMLAKIASNAAARSTNSGAVEMGRIEALFETAKASGLKRLAFVAEGLKIAPAPVTGRNAGAYYVSLSGEYQGKIAGGNFYATGSADPATLGRLAEIAADPAGVARMYGKKTGTCCCCGRELTDPASIEAGIGPVCAERWGL